MDTKEQTQAVEPHKIVAVVSMNDGEALVLDRPVKLIYEKVGKDYIGRDGIFRDFLRWENWGGAFAGRTLTLNLVDGTTVQIKDNWWSAGGEGCVDVGVSTVDALTKCYVFGGSKADPQALEELRAAYTGCVYPYWDYEKLTAGQKLLKWYSARNTRDERLIRAMKAAVKQRNKDALMAQKRVRELEKALNECMEARTRELDESGDSFRKAAMVSQTQEIRRFRKELAAVSFERDTHKASFEAAMPHVKTLEAIENQLLAEVGKPCLRIEAVGTILAELKRHRREHSAISSELSTLGFRGPAASVVVAHAARELRNRREQAKALYGHFAAISASIGWFKETGDGGMESVNCVDWDTLLQRAIAMERILEQSQPTQGEVVILTALGGPGPAEERIIDVEPPLGLGDARVYTMEDNFPSLGDLPADSGAPSDRERLEQLTKALKEHGEIIGSWFPDLHLPTVFPLERSQFLIRQLKRDLDKANSSVVPIREALKNITGKFAYMDGPEGWREAMTQAEAALVGVWTNCAPASAITFYESRHYYLSNFSAFAVVWDGLSYPTSEHLYQALKFEGAHMRELIRNQSSAHEAMKKAQLCKTSYRLDWAEIKVSVMEEVCRAKLEQHPYIQRKLMETGGAPLVEASPIDSFWGWGPNKDGQNHLGRVWMNLRQELLGKEKA